MPAKYRLIYKPKHPNSNTSGYIYEHRWVMEQYLGRYLTKNEHVHHINNNGKDNRIENLQLLSKSEHSKITYKNTSITHKFGRPKGSTSRMKFKRRSKKHILKQ